VERNHYWVAIKSFPLSWLILLPFFTLARLVHQTMAVLRDKGAGGAFRCSGSRVELVAALFKGTLEGLQRLPVMLKKRRQILCRARLSDREMARLLRRYRMSFRELLDV
jgi:hypothetical protein